MLLLWFMEYWTEVMTLAVLNRSRDVMPFFSWLCRKTVLNLSLVIHDVPKRISEYIKYFESF